MFGKQLVQFAGVSSEMAIEILAKYPTLDRYICLHQTCRTLDDLIVLFWSQSVMCI